MCVPQHLCRNQRTFMEVLSLNHVGSREQRQVIRFEDKRLKAAPAYQFLQRSMIEF